MSPAPALPDDRLDADGWTLSEESTETLFSLPTTSVEGHTRLYEDGALRDRLGDATGTDQIWRFFFATAVTFSPSLAPGIGPAMIRPSVASEAKRVFEKDLRARGFEHVTRGRRERMRSRDGDRIRLQEFTATLPVADVDVPITGWLGVWTVGTDFRIGGGAYPDLPKLGGALGLDDLGPPPRACRDDLFRLIRAVS